MRRTLRVVAITCLLLTGCQEGTTPSDAGQREGGDTIPDSFNVEGNPTTEFQVTAIHCEGCRKAACDVLAEVPGVIDVYASPHSQQVVIAVDDAYFDGAVAQKALEERFGEVLPAPAHRTPGVPND